MGNPLITTMKAPKDVNSLSVNGLVIEIGKDGYVDVPVEIGKDLEAHGFVRQARPEAKK